jgi:hypothetical protein
VGQLLTGNDFDEAPPHGFGMSAAEVQALIDGKPLRQRLAGDPSVKPAPKHGGDRSKRGDKSTLKGRGSTSAEYLVRRLKRDRPDIAKALADGEYKSARAAGIAAGIVKVPSPLEQAKRAAAKLSAADLRAFRHWLDERG